MKRMKEKGGEKINKNEISELAAKWY